MKTRFELSEKKWTEFIQKLRPRTHLPKLKALLSSLSPFREGE